MKRWIVLCALVAPMVAGCTPTSSVSPSTQTDDPGETVPEENADETVPEENVGDPVHPAFLQLADGSMKCDKVTWFGLEPVWWNQAVPAFYNKSHVSNFREG